MADMTSPAAPPPVPFEPPEHKTYSLWFALLGLMLVIVSITAVWDETYWRRPWKHTQKEFLRKARATYTAALDAAERDLGKTQQSDDYAKARKALADAQKTFAAQTLDPALRDDTLAKLKALNVTAPPTTGDDGQPLPPYVWFDRVASAIQTHTDARRKEFQAIRGTYQSALWQWETYHSAASDAVIKANEADVDARTQELTALDALRGQMNTIKSNLSAARDSAAAALAAFDSERDAAAKRLEGLGKESIGIRQAFVPELDVVDRCESCHMGIQKTGLEALAQPYRNHPGNWLKTHPVEKFGCTPCHRGDGFSTESAWQAHGEDPYWLKPMLHGDLAQAACYKCHSSQLVIPGAPVLTKGKKLFKELGCWGCHKMRGFGMEEQELADLTADVEKLRKDLDGMHATYKGLDSGARADLAPSLNALEAEFHAKESRQKDLLQQIRHVGPDLTDVRSKLKPGWMEYWLEEPRRFRPATRMPAFWPKLSDKDAGPDGLMGDPDYDERGKLERHAIISYLWSSSDSQAPAAPAAQDDKTLKDDQAAGKDLVESRGCRGCHNVTTEDAKTVPEPRFAPALDRVGEKTTAAWIERWVKNPRAVQPGAKMPNLRLTDKEAHQVAAYLASLTSKTPPELPEPRFLTDETVAQTEAKRLAQLDGSAIVGTATTLPEMGQKVIGRYGCFGCHQVKGFEKASKIGTELSSHGSKFLELLDHALLEEDLMQKGGGEPWEDYVEGKFDNPEIPQSMSPEALKAARENLRREFLKGPQGQTNGLTHQGWFSTKLMNPRIFDRKKRKKAEERLKMPNFRLKPDEIYALVTFIMGNTEEIDALPASARYEPKGPARAIIQGEKIIHKLNCTGCHRFEEVPTSDQQVVIDRAIHALDEAARKKAEAEHVDLAKDPRKGQCTNAQKQDVRDHVLEGEFWHFAPSDDKTLTPPPLYFEGNKAQPRWVFDFLKAPFQMRPRHEVRMPTFDMSDEEAAALVEYFTARARNTFPFEGAGAPPDAATLAQGKAMVEKSQCLKCHVPGLPGMSEEDVKAPDLRLAPQKLRASWIAPWTLDPQRFQADVIMPSFSDTWGKDADATAQAIAQYLTHQDTMSAAAGAPATGASPGPGAPPGPTPSASPSAAASPAPSTGK